MENDQTNRRGGKLSLTLKRRREKRSKNANASKGSNGSKGGNANERIKKRPRMPIPSFSPLDENCDIIGTEQSQKNSCDTPTTPTHTTMMSKANHNHNHNHAHHAARDENIINGGNSGVVSSNHCRSRQKIDVKSLTLEVQVPLRVPVPAAIVKGSEHGSIKTNMISVDSGSGQCTDMIKNGDKKENPLLKFVCTEKSNMAEEMGQQANRTIRCHAQTSDAKVEMNSPVRVEQELHIPTNIEQNSTSIGTDRPIVMKLERKLNQETFTGFNNEQCGALKCIDRSIETKVEKQSRPGKKSEMEVEMTGSASVEQDDTCQYVQERALEEKRDHSSLLSLKNEDQKPTAITSKRKSTSKKSKVARASKPSKLVDTIFGSPSLEDFQVSRGKYLNDKEKNLKTQHADLLGMSKNAEIAHERSVSPLKRVAVAQRKRTNTRARPTKSKLCTLCSTCSCSRGSALQSLEDSAISEQQNPLHRLARTEAEVERALIGRLSRLEKSASWFDHLCTKVGRELKRHRARIKATIQDGNNAVKPTFLKDVDADDEEHFSAPAMSTSFVNRAKRQIFSFRKKAQPTLTQMLGDSDNDAGDNERSDSKLETMAEDGGEEGGDHELGKDQGASTKVDDYSNDGNLNHEDISYSRNISRSRSLWKASTMTEQQFQESNVKHDFSQTLQEEKDLNMIGNQIEEEDYYDNGLSELLDAFDNVDDNSDGDENNSAATSIDDMLGSIERNETCLDEDDKVVKNEAIDPITFSQLSPVAKVAFDSMACKIESDPEKVKLLNAECPNWKENLRFTLRQDPDDIKEALASIQAKQNHITKALEMLKNKNVVLNVFKMAMEESLERFDDRGDDIRKEIDFLSQSMQN